MSKDETILTWEAPRRLQVSSQLCVLGQRRCQPALDRVRPVGRVPKYPVRRVELRALLACHLCEACRPRRELDVDAVRVLDVHLAQRLGARVQQQPPLVAGRAHGRAPRRLHAGRTIVWAAGKRSARNGSRPAVLFGRAWLRAGGSHMGNDEEGRQPGNNSPSLHDDPSACDKTDKGFPLVLVF